jgi:large subunit ribosomal protein L15
MMIHEITEKVGKHRRRARVGRGESSGMGKTSGRGHKGAKSRSGWSLPPQYQGGQINFIQKMPKRGFNNAQFRRDFNIVNVKALDAIAQAGDEVTAQTLLAAGVIRNAALPLKVLGEGELTKKITVTANRFSASAKSKIEAAGGTVNQLDPTPVKRQPAPPPVAESAGKDKEKDKGKEKEKSPKKSKPDATEEN